MLRFAGLPFAHRPARRLGLRKRRQGPMPLDSSNPHSRELPVRGVAQIRYECDWSGTLMDVSMAEVKRRR